MGQRRREITKAPLYLPIWHYHKLYDLVNYMENNYNMILQDWNGPKFRLLS